MAISALGYLGVRSDNLDDWSGFACGLLGMQRVDRAGKTVAFRMDDHSQRLVVSAEAGDTLSFIGWEVDAKSDLETYAARLENADVKVEVGSRALADRRYVEELIVLDDPDGNRLELFWNPLRDNDPFVPGRPISGFKTGPLGMGHAVLHVRDAEQLLPFYRDLLDFHVSDYGLTPFPLYFFHVNGRHHSFAMVGSGKQGLHHFMIEFNSLDDVGQGYDLAQIDDDRVAFSLGRHTNDYMTSFYVHTPSGFFVENGWGGRVIDPETWSPHETFDGPSLWGHERLHLPEKQRAVMREMRLDVAARGIQAPLMVDCPWLYQSLAKDTGKRHASGVAHECIERETLNPESFDVVIVGYGPVGATLANLLGLCGVSTLVLERESAVYHLPRAVHFDDEVMRIFQTVGLADVIETTTRTNPGMRFVDANGKLLLDWPRPQEVSPNGWRSSYRFHQPDLERILRGGVERYPHVQAITRAAVRTLEQTAERVEVCYEDLDEGRSNTVTAKYVVGCDGARSTVRDFIGSETEDYGFHERWLVVDTILKRAKPELGDHSIQYCRPDRPATYVRGPGNRRRWEVTVLDHETTEAISSPSSVWSLLKDWITPDDAELERAVVYMFHSLIARRWRRGRLLIAGDAAHQTPPFMGQGMCAGMRDVANLAWKLALVLNQQAPADLLDTYQSERHPNVREYVETAVRLGGLINTCATEQALRAAFKQPDGTARMESIKPRIGPGLSADDDELVGTMFPQPIGDDGWRMDDLATYRPILLIDSDATKMIDSEMNRELSDAGVAIINRNEISKSRDYLGQSDLLAVSIRPDRYVLGTARNERELRALAGATLASPLIGQKPL